MCFSFEPPFIRYFPLPECRSPCELKRVVFRCSEIFEPTASMNSSGWQLWHSMVHLLKAKNQGLRGSAVSCSLRYRARALEPKKPSLVHHDVVPFPHPLPAPGKHSSSTDLKNVYPASCGFISTGERCSFRVFAATKNMGWFNCLEGIELQVSCQTYRCWSFSCDSRVPKFDPK